MADDRLSCCRSELIVAINSDKLFCRWTAISFRLSQNSSSRLTLVLLPAITTERLTTGDFIESTPPYLYVFAASNYKIRALLWASKKQFWSVAKEDVGGGGHAAAGLDSKAFAIHIFMDS